MFSKNFSQFTLMPFLNFTAKLTNEFSERCSHLFLNLHGLPTSFQVLPLSYALPGLFTFFYLPTSLSLLILRFTPFWAAAPKGRCPVRHRGELSDIRTSVHPYLPPPWKLLKA